MILRALRRRAGGRRAMSLSIAIALSFLVLSASSIGAAEIAASQIDIAIGAAVERLKRSAADPRAVEYRRFRHLAILDLDGDGAGSLVAAFNIESGESNAVRYYVGVWKRSSAGRLVEQSVVELNTVTFGMPIGTPTLSVDGRIVVPAVRYAMGDSRCCPSIQGTIRFTLRGDQLVGEVAP